MNETFECASLLQRIIWNMAQIDISEVRFIQYFNINDREGWLKGFLRSYCHQNVCSATPLQGRPLKDTDPCHTLTALTCQSQKKWSKQMNIEGQRFWSNRPALVFCVPFLSAVCVCVQYQPVYTLVVFHRCSVCRGQTARAATASTLHIYADRQNKRGVK